MTLRSKLILILLTLILIPFQISLAKISGVGGLDRDALIAELTGKPVQREDEKTIFIEILRGYQSDNWTLLDRNLKTLLTLHPKSPLADNGIYLAGLYQFHRRKYGVAIEYFNRILRDYSHSEKAVSATFAKGMTYKTMGLPELAKSKMNQVIKSYPGSPESLRAGLEIRMIK